jgi:hypothetical protein
MAAFRDYIEQHDFVEFVLNEFDGQIQAKPWSAKKPEIMQMWGNLRQDSPIYMTPISKGMPGQIQGSGHSYGEDGIRVTGSWPFIASVLGRMKEILAYENPQTKLRLIFRGVDQSRSANPDRQTFVFYVNLEERGRGRSGRPRKIGV